MSALGQIHCVEQLYERVIIIIIIVIIFLYFIEEKAEAWKGSVIFLRSESS